MALALLASLMTAGPAAALETLFWHDDYFPLPIHLQDAGPISDLSMQDQEKILQRAIDTWNSVPCASISLVYAGRVPIEGSMANDYRIDIAFVRAPEVWSPAGTTGNTSVMDRDASDPTPRQFKIDVFLNGVDHEWADGINDPTMSVVDMESVVVHELGHVLGLGHSGCKDGFCETGESNASTMAERYLPDLGTRSLALLDKMALCQKYWVPVGECDGDDPCDDGHECVHYAPEGLEEESVGLCAEPVGHEGDQCDGLDGGLICQDHCIFVAADRSEGYCSVACERDQECPDFWICTPGLPGVDADDLYCRDPAAEPSSAPPRPPKDDGLCHVAALAGTSATATFYSLLGLGVLGFVGRRRKRYNP